jgi:hypothetical protein
MSKITKLTFDIHMRYSCEKEAVHKIGMMVKYYT